MSSAEHRGYTEIPYRLENDLAVPMIGGAKRDAGPARLPQEH
jgi:hypothetical protein